MNAVAVISLAAVKQALSQRMQICDGVVHAVVASSTTRGRQQKANQTVDCYLAPFNVEGQLLAPHFAHLSNQMFALADPARMPVRVLH